MTRVPARRPSIRDIASAAGVSITTVSHALNGKGRVSSDTRERVIRTAERLGYSANVHARRLASGRNQTLAIQVSDGGGQLVPPSSYFLRLLNGAAEAAAARSYTLLLVPPAAFTSAHHIGVDGLIVVDPSNDEPLLDQMLLEGVEIVTTGRILLDGAEVPWVDNDHSAATRRGLDHLRKRGYLRPALIRSVPTRSYTVDMTSAYVQWCETHQVRPVIVTLSDPPTEAAGRRATREMLAHDPAPDAIYTTLDIIALGALRALAASGLSVPEDVALMSAVEGESLHWTSPPITGVQLYSERLGARAADLLIRRLEDDPSSPGGELVSTRIMPRASTRRREETSA